MPYRPGAPHADPMLGVYFGIFAACLAAGVLLLLIFEQLGLAEASLKTAMAGVSIALFVTIGLGAYTNRAREFLFVGRRVPAIYNGMAMAIAGPGGVGLVGIAGSLFLAGFDMLCIGVGIVAGLTVSVMLIAPFLRKFGAPTVPSFLGQRFESGTVRLLAASVASVPLMLIAVAEIKIAIMAGAWLLPLSSASAALLVVLVLVATIAPGGVRSLSWSTAAQSMVVLVAILLPAGIAAVMETNLPFGQLSHGPLLRTIGRIEAAQNVPIPVAGLLAVDLPDVGLQPITGRFATTFGTIGPLAFVLLALSVLAGIAGSPSLLARSATTPSVYDTRKSMGWAVALVGVLLMTFSSVAVFERDLLLNAFVGHPSAAVPTGLQRLVDLGLASVESRPTRMTATSVLFDRDGTLLALPILLGMPLAVVNLVAAGVLAAALAGAAASVTQLGVIIGDDVINAPAGERSSDAQRLWVCRLAITAAAALAGFGAVLVGGDPLLLLLHGLAISGSALFPVIALSIWWKRATTAGALAGMATGFVTAALVMLADLSSIGLPALLAPAIAVPAAVAATMLVSHLTPAPGRHILELVRDLRVPGGETIHDREARQARHRGTRTR